MSNPLTLPRLVEPATLETHLNDANICIVQVCSPERYAEGHVPGAHHVPPQALLLGVPPLVGMTPSLAQIKQLVERLQINQNTWVVALDDEGGGWAGRFLWTLEMVGFQRWSLLNGGLWAWSGDGHALAQPATHTSAGPDRPKPAEEQLPGAAAWPCQWAEAQPTVDAQTLLKHLADPQWVIWDARSAAEYAGDRQSALRNGHIPGAQHYEWTQAMDKERHLRLRDPDTLRQELAERGITGDKTIVTHCHSHHRSGYTWVLGRLLGFDNIKAYPGSWGEWGNSADLPVVTGEAPQRPAE